MNSSPSSGGSWSRCISKSCIATTWLLKRPRCSSSPSGVIHPRDFIRRVSTSVVSSTSVICHHASGQYHYQPRRATPSISDAGTILSTRKAAMKTTSNRNARIIDPANNARNTGYSYSSHEDKYGSDTTCANIPRFFFAYHHPSTLYAEKHMCSK